MTKSLPFEIDPDITIEIVALDNPPAALFSEKMEETGYVEKGDVYIVLPPVNDEDFDSPTKETVATAYELGERISVEEFSHFLHNELENFRELWKNAREQYVKESEAC